MKRLLTYGLLLLTILASHFVVSACQEDLPETTEVMMTFTTRAVVTQNNENDVINVEKMQDLRVIVVRENGDIVYNDTKSVGGESTATVSFNTPVKTGGENFKFFAIANYSSLVNEPNYTDIDGLITHEVGDGNEIPIFNPIPQTKYWVYPVKQLLGQTQSVTKTLDYLASKISVQFKNETNKAQSLSNIHITGITPNGNGRLFNRPTGEKDDKGEEIYEEVYVTENDVTLNNGITFNGVADLPSGESSAIQHYYTYPVDNGNISSPTLYAKWGDEVDPRRLELTGFTELKRNDHLKILITLTDVGIKVTYTIADWEENTTTIGGVNPTLGDSYMVKDWVQGDDVVIGEEPVEPEGPVTVEGLTISANPATIDLASATATTLTIIKPANITTITITPSGNSAFTGLSNPSSGSTDNFKITGLSNNAETVTVTLTANSNADTGSYTLTASGTGGDDYISNEATTTITLSKTQSGGGENPDDDLGDIVKNYTPVWTGELKHNQNHNLSNSCKLNSQDHLVAGNSVIVGFIYNDERKNDSYTVWFKTSWSDTVLSDRFGFTKDSKTHYVRLDLTSEMISKINNQGGLFLAVSEDCIKINSVYIIPSTN